MQDRDTQRVYRLDEFSKARLIRPGVACCVAGKVNSADKLYLAVESVRLDTKHRRASTAPVPADGARNPKMHRFRILYRNPITVGPPAHSRPPTHSCVPSRKSAFPAASEPPKLPLFSPAVNMVEEQSPDGLPPHAWYQPASHRFLGHQSHGPTGAALRRAAAHHGDDPLLLAILQNRRRPGPLLVVQRGFGAAGLVTMADFPNRLRSERDHAGDLWCTNPLGQLPKRQSSQDHTDLLYAAAQEVGQFDLVFRLDFDVQGWTSHTPGMRQNISGRKYFLELFQAVMDLAAHR